MSEISKQSIGDVIEIAEERFVRIASNGMLYEAEKGFAIAFLNIND